MTGSRRASFRARLRGALIFVAIAWGVAGSFVGLELVALRGFETLGGSSIALSRAVQNSTVCDSPLTTAAGSVDGQAWMLGVYAGTQARVSQWLSPSGQTTGDTQAQEQFRNRARALNDLVQSELAAAAERLAVPLPSAFSPRDAVNAVIEYVPFVEGPADVTAAAIAAAYGRRPCELYKLGSYWGFGAVVRNAGVEHPYDVELNHYARKLSLPEALWQPILAPFSDNDGRPPDTDALTNGITQYLTSSR